ncbi:MAG: DnaD domain protein [Bacilli bacterium]|nr:DnaD domain protein [Bacilli bacterium]
MTGKVIELLKNGTFIVPKLLLINYKKFKISDNELIVLIYLLNNNEFDPDRISHDLGLDIKELLTVINSLTKKDILCLNSVTNNNVCEEYVCLDSLYNKLALSMMENKSEKKEVNIFDQFEKEFARTLSPMEYEIIGAWFEDGFNEETINLALKEAVYNGVNNLRYIDKILYEWKKKGIKTKADMDNNLDINKKKSSKEEVFDYDWLNE